MEALRLSTQERSARNEAFRVMPGPLVSILINNYNYARFLGVAIDSALAQTYPSIEVVVVDDGSTDNSREVISRYGERIIPVLKENGGQASSFNAGVSACRGEILCFLDADDFFHPGKVARVIDAFAAQGMNSRPIMLHHLLAVKNDTGDAIEDRPYGKTHASPMNLYAFAKRYHFIWYEAGPTTSISVNRRLADLLFPIPEKGVRVSGDDFIVCGASLVGDVYSLAEILGGYRVHGNNHWFRSDRRKSPEFMAALQNYLNAKLVESGRSPVISFNDSIYAWPDLVADRRWIALAWQMLKLSVKQHDRYTARWVFDMLVRIARLMKSTLRQQVQRVGGAFIR
jgi:glycosyltransferase involved in cell wall biosynthesis